mmetsp:Transcript_14843/g.46697  ORF Transcript_14843/g.46697 Transcript_14843/m.46697 type:complete len:115 (+) Transcript_14843:1079-1423(+)
MGEFIFRFARTVTLHARPSFGPEILHPSRSLYFTFRWYTWSLCTDLITAPTITETMPVTSRHHSTTRDVINGRNASTDCWLYRSVFIRRRPDPGGDDIAPHYRIHAPSPPPRDR